ALEPVAGGEGLCQLGGRLLRPGLLVAADEDDGLALAPPVLARGHDPRPLAGGPGAGGGGGGGDRRGGGAGGRWGGCPGARRGRSSGGRGGQYMRRSGGTEASG